MLIHKIAENLTCEGPGLRTAIWTQGCEIRCPGCFNEAAQDLDGGEEISVYDLVARISKNDKIRGITIAGGEPFLQLYELKQLLSNIKYARPDLDIMLYSGYKFEVIKSNREMFEVAKLSDAFICGPYMQEYSPDARSWIGSTNQDGILFSDRLKAELIPWPKGKRQEVIISADEINIFGEPLLNV